MRLFLFAPVCLATMLLQASFTGVTAVGRSFSQGNRLRSAGAGGVSVASPAEMEEQEEDMEVMEEASVPEAPKSMTQFQPQAMLQFPSYASLQEKPMGGSVDPPHVAKVSSQKNDVRVPSPPFMQALRKEPSTSPIPSSDVSNVQSATLTKLPIESSQDEKTALEAHLVEAPVKQPWPPPSKRRKCHPECMQGRGVCNDNVCFCKSPYSGVSCQHKIEDLSRFSYPIVIAFGVFCFIISSVIARIVFWCPCLPSQEATSNHVKQEIWHPPDGNSKKKPDVPKPETSPEPSHGHDDHT